MGNEEGELRISDCGMRIGGNGEGIHHGGTESTEAWVAFLREKTEGSRAPSSGGEPFCFLEDGLLGLRDVLLLGQSRLLLVEKTETVPTLLEIKNLLTRHFDLNKDLAWAFDLERSVGKN